MPSQTWLLQTTRSAQRCRWKRWQNDSVPIQKLTNTDAFVAIDLDGAPSSGIVRSGPKILQGGAKDLARSLTYAFATLEMQRGGASAGINAKPEDRDSAIAAFVDELTPQVANGTLSLRSGKGVSASSLATLEQADDRHKVANTRMGLDDLATHLSALGPVVAAESVLGGLDSKRVAIEGFGAAGPALATAAVERGAQIVALSTSAGSIQDSGGFTPGDLRARWDAEGDRLIGDDANPAWKIFGAEADVLFAGSKIGAINHETAANLRVQAVVPHSALPFTARALAVMQQRGITAVADFIPTAAPLLAYWPGDEVDAAAIVALTEEAIRHALDESSGHADGPFLGACHRAEAYLPTWRDELPFGRPIAS